VAAELLTQAAELLTQEKAGDSQRRAAAKMLAWRRRVRTAADPPALKTAGKAVFAVTLRG
jgi:hypothetical protein